MLTEFLNVAPWVAVSAVISWLASLYVHYEKRSDLRVDRGDKLEIHRDELTFELLQGARAEMSTAREEVIELRDENRKLRSMESHFYHFQQAIDHLEAILFPENPESFKIAERNARAFLQRMKKLQKEQT
jgi:hypothetical protein